MSDFTSKTLTSLVSSEGDSNKKAITLAVAAAAAISAGAGVWWLSRESYYSYVPLRYQYRPGTFTAWISRVLDSHAKRRRSESACMHSCVHQPLCSKSFPSACKLTAVALTLPQVVAPLGCIWTVASI